ncbi:NAD(P)-dependent alcohol dehydrogenase [Dactylosporangium siamense]|uniref:NADPH:quinone reductase n=1 Tax=Dactylosporangium siamense TaxID=685454 RepID=A0A919Q042_9ACTN|nr:NAD(P)-dependent alcohol dehydrogenase [Dactylosporangium siamense]GIG51470.1 NADPH:quinone reductase [Dactylosporangium siamense]
MKAIVQDRYGPSDVLRLGEVDPPVAAAGEVLVRVHAASVNARDWHVMRGDPYVARMAFGLGAPKVRVRGTDFAGRVEAVGAGVTGFRPGDEVFGEIDAAFAEYVRIPATGPLAIKPANLTFEQAAALPTAANTALMGLRDAARVTAGQHVLINGASGGVGTFAVQIAKAFGARVTAVCSTRNLDLVRSLGADRVIDYTREDFTLGADRYDVVFDLVGNHALADCRRVLTPAGALVLSGGGVSEGGSLFGPVRLIARARVVSRFVRHRVLALVAVPSRKNLETLGELFESGAVTPVIDRTFPLSDGAEAVRYLEMDHARAKVVITV